MNRKDQIESGMETGAQSDGAVARRKGFLMIVAFCGFRPEEIRAY